MDRSRRILVLEHNSAFLNSALNLRGAAIALSKRKREGVTPHQHLSHFVPMRFRFMRDFLQQLSDVRMIESDAPKLLWQMIGTAVFILDGG